MSELNDEIVNKGLAEAMGLKFSGIDLEIGEFYYRGTDETDEFEHVLYTESLDASFQIITKLPDYFQYGYYKTYEDKWLFGIWDTPRDAGCGFYEWGDPKYQYEHKELKKAASYAFYKACKELGLIKENR